MMEMSERAGIEDDGLMEVVVVVQDACLASSLWRRQKLQSIDQE